MRASAAVTDPLCFCAARSLRTGNLELICFLYNGILSTLLDVERPLVSKQITTIDAALDKGLNDLNWNSHKIEDYISEVMAMLKDLNSTLVTIKGNVTKTRSILDKWEEKLMFERKDGKVYNADEFKDSFKNLLSTRYNDIADGGLEISKLLTLTNKTLKVSKGAPAWKAYVEFVNEIVSTAHFS